MADTKIMAGNVQIIGKRHKNTGKGHKYSGKNLEFRGFFSIFVVDL